MNRREFQICLGEPVAVRADESPFQRELLSVSLENASKASKAKKELACSQRTVVNVHSTLSTRSHRDNDWQIR